MATSTAPKLPEALTRKIGPLPLWAWLLIGGGLLYYFKRQQDKAAAAATGQVTDPAGNVCSALNTQTGFCPGTAQDLQAQAAQAAQGGQGGPIGGTSGNAPAFDTSGTTGGGDTTGGGGPVTPAGTPTTTPGAPAASPPGPAVTRINRGGNWQYPAPNGLAASEIKDTGFRLSWQPVQGPQGQRPGTYTVQTFQGNSKVDQFVSGSTNTAEYGGGGRGLKPSTQYKVNVWANGGPVAPPHASIVVTTRPRGGK